MGEMTHSNASFEILRRSTNGLCIPKTYWHKGPTECGFLSIGFCYCFCFLFVKEYTVFSFFAPRDLTGLDIVLFM